MQVEFRKTLGLSLLDCSAYGVAPLLWHSDGHGDAFRRQRGEHRQASPLRDRRMRGDEVAYIDSV